jgi:hypothetical protein
LIAWMDNSRACIYMKQLPICVARIWNLEER